VGGFFTPPAFTPPVPPIALGTTGQVLTMVGGRPQFTSPGGTLGSYLAYVSATGTLNDVTPAGFGGGIGLLDVTLPSGPATWTGLAAGVNHQELIIANADTVSALTLAALNGASQPGNQFRNSGDLFIPPLAAVLLVYYTTPALWIVNS
jgi:hypothetical protein